MANTYIKIYLHLVFAVKNRESMLFPSYQPRIHAYMAQALLGMGHLPVIVGGVADHIHILMCYSGKQSLPDMVRDLKINTAKFINGQRMTGCHFQWQKGYACFSYSHSHVPAVKNYILNQYEHHKGCTFREEVRRMLNLYGVEYEEEYLFEDV